jgi:pantothenate kinase
MTVSSLEELRAWQLSAPPHRILGIIGPPGSGKSTLSADLSRHLTAHHVVIPMDGFHYPQARLVELGRRDRMGAPDTFDTAALAAKLRLAATRTQPVDFPSFDRRIEEPVEDQILVDPSHDLIVLEGNYLLLDDEHWSPIGELLDLSIYVDIPDDIRLERLITRHCDFGKSLEDATEWVHRVDEANAKVIAESASRADVRYQPLDASS